MIFRHGRAATTSDKRRNQSDGVGEAFNPRVGKMRERFLDFA